MANHVSDIDAAVESVMSSYRKLQGIDPKNSLLRYISDLGKNEFTLEPSLRDEFYANFPSLANEGYVLGSLNSYHKALERASEGKSKFLFRNVGV
jgi:hypothetical protein